MADVTQITEGKKAAAGKKYLTKSEILAATDISFMEMEVSQWGGTVRFRALTGNEAIDFQKVFKDEDTKESAVIRLFAISAVDENGDRIFDDSDVRELRKKSWAAFLKAQNKLLEFNGFTDKSTTKNA